MAFGNSSRDVTVRLRAETASYIAQMRLAGSETKRAAQQAEGFNSSAGKMGNQIDTLSGRVGLAVDALATIGPSVVPITGVAIPAVVGLGTQMGFAALAGGTMVAAFQGVGTALKAVNKAAIDPTTQNITAANEAMAAISPTAQAFVQKLRDITPELLKLRDTAAAGFFPGATEGIDSLIKLMPTAQRIVGAMAGELGDIAADSGASLASGRWEDFFRFLETEGPRSLRQLADSAGNTGHAVAEMLVAFAPESRKVGDYLVEETGKLDAAASKLKGSDGFANFLDYVNTEGPQVAATFGAIGNAAVQIVQATAPLGGPALKAVEGLANGFAALAGSDLGTPIFAGIAALRAYSLAASVAEKASARFQQSSSGGSRLGAAAGTYQAQVSAVRQIPAVYSRAAAAQAELAAAQAKAGTVTSRYVRQLQTANTMASRPDLANPTFRQLGRLDESLAQVEKANTAVAASTAKAKAAEAERSATVRAGAIGIAKTAAGVGALAVASSGLGDKLGVSNTLTLGLAGSMAGPLGAGLGAAAGAMIDLSHASDGAEQALTGIKAAIGTGDLDQLRARLAGVKAELKDMNGTSSFGDFLGDAAKSVGLAFKGKLGIASELKSEAFKARAELETINAPASGVGAVLTQSLGAGARKAAGDMDFLTQSVVQFRSSLKSLSGELDLQSGLIGFRDALRGIKDTVDQNPLGDKLATGLGKAGRQGDAVRKSLIGAAQAALQVADKMSDADAKPYLANARKQIIGLARDAGLPIAAVRRILAGFGELDGKQANVKVNADTKGAVMDFDHIKAALKTLPPQVRTAVSTPGAVKSIADIRQLATANKLNGKQIRLVAQLAGVQLTKRQLASISGDVSKLNGKRARPSASLQDKASGPIKKVDASMGRLGGRHARPSASLSDRATGPINKVDRGLQGLARKNPRPTVTLIDRASGPIASVAARLGALNGRTAFTYATTIVSTVNKKADGGPILPGMAGGGQVAGQRYPYGDKVVARVIGGGEVALAPGEEIITNRNGEADRFRADRAAGRIPAYANGGTPVTSLVSGGRGTTAISVTFPTPAVVAASVKAAEAVAVSAAKTSRSYRDTQDATLATLQAQQRVSELEKSLAERGKKRVRGRDGIDDDKRKKGLQDKYKYVGYSKLTGIARDTAKAELTVAKRDLADLKNVQSAIDDLTESRKTAVTTLSGNFDLFARGTGAGSALSSTTREIANVTAYGQTIAKLKAAGASGGLLAQVIAKGDSGDLRGAIRFGNALLAQPAVLGQLNSSLATLDQVRGNVATLTTDPRLMASAAWNPTSTVVSQKTATVLLQADPSTWMATLRAQVTHDVVAAIAGTS